MTDAERQEVAEIRKEITAKEAELKELEPKIGLASTVKPSETANVEVAPQDNNTIELIEAAKSDVVAAINSTDIKVKERMERSLKRLQEKLDLANSVTVSQEIFDEIEATKAEIIKALSETDVKVKERMEQQLKRLEKKLSDAQAIKISDDEFDALESTRQDLIKALQNTDIKIKERLEPN